ncbi:hypothetical protein LAUMK41_05070 [Mycobacterium attenuatum]|nr:hypothetical protein LAUMK41_05070 [Mycobacterium attenuatum]
MAAGTAGTRARSAHAAGAAKAQHPPAVTTGPAVRANAAGATHAAVAPQPRRPAGATSLAGTTSCPIAAVAEQDAAVSASAAGDCRVGTVADQRSAQQQLGRRIHQVEHVLLEGLQW